VTRIECPHEEVVVQAVLTGAWPERCDEALVAHATECNVCREVIGIAALMREDGEQSRNEAHVPAAGQVWWRAAVRARLESTHTATRPMTWMHGITAAIVVGVLLAGITAAWPYLPGSVDRVWALTLELLSTTEVVGAVAWGLRQSVVLGLFAVAFLLITPLALYFVLSDD